MRFECPCGMSISHTRGGKVCANCWQYTDLRALELEAELAARASCRTCGPGEGTIYDGVGNDHDCPTCATPRYDVDMNPAIAVIVIVAIVLGVLIHPLFALIALLAFLFI